MCVCVSYLVPHERPHRSVSVAWLMYPPPLPRVKGTIALKCVPNVHDDDACTAKKTANVCYQVSW